MTSFCRRMRFLARIAAVFLCVPAVFAVVSWATTPQTDASKQAPRRDLTIADLFQIKDVADAQASPDGRWVAYTVGSTSLKEERSEGQIWMVPMAGGIKWNGLAVNGQYFMRWLSEFEADGPLPLASTYDHGFELTAGYFVIPKNLQLYACGSAVFGHFGNSSEYGGGARWYFLPTERLWLNAELVRVNHVPYSGAFTPVTAGLTGWVPMLQAVLAF